MTDEPIDWSEHYYANPSKDMPDNLWRRWMRDGHLPLGRRLSEPERNAGKRRLRGYVRPIPKTNLL
jgi:hypothetical protein